MDARNIHEIASLVPFGDPCWVQIPRSVPHYGESHNKFALAIRQFVDHEIMPYCKEWDEQRAVPQLLRHKLFQAGILPGVLGAPWPKEYGGSNIAGGVLPEQFDTFHELILADELARCASGGVLWYLFGGLAIGLAPLIHFGSKELCRRIAPLCLKGEKVICLAVTEPYGGSDVANIKTTARKTPDGEYFIVNGAKKWITNGVFADYFTVAVRTGGEGAGGLSFLLIERNMGGVVTTQMDCQGVWASGTTFITFEDVRVPASNLIGKENEGFKYIMYNFNHERWMLAVQANRFARVCYEEAFEYAHKRRVFGKRLIDLGVVRNKLANMARRVEATHHWIEMATYQRKTLSLKQQQAFLGGPTALLKAQATQTFEFCAREASQIFGGLSYTRSGLGEKIERLYREVRVYAIGGGSEELMLDFAMRDAARKYQKQKNATSKM